ncbi:MAG: hypothetical protein HFE86_00355 [Clostridiales bacterium]|nr:hypothetical protein [Clostridiales bacterium]
MKRLWCLLLTVLLCFCFPAAAGAAQSSLYHTGEISEAGITLNFPSEVTLITRSGLEDDRIQQEMWDNGLNPFFFEQDMEELDYYIYAYSQKSNFTLIVSVQTDGFSEQIGNYSQLPDRVKQAFMEFIEESIDEAETDQMDAYAVWREDCPQAIFLEVDYNGGQHARIYQTVFNGKTVTLSFLISDGDTPPDGELWDSIFRSLRFDEEQVKPRITQPFPWEYTDSVTGATLTVPARWAEEVTLAGQMTRFVSEDQQKNEIDFYAQDIKMKLDNSKASRRYMDLKAVSPATVAEIAGVSESELDEVECAGLPFYHYARQTERKYYDIPYTEPCHVYIHIRDGYLYSFFTNFETDDPAFSDFTDLVSSIDYPEVQESLVQRMSSLIGNPMLILMDSAARTAIYTDLFLYLLGLLTLPLVLFRFLIRKRAVKAAAGLLTSIVCGAVLFVLLHFLSSIFPLLPYGTTLAGVIALAWGTGVYFLLHKGYRPPEGEKEPPAITADSFIYAGEKKENPAAENSVGAEEDRPQS